MEKKINAKQFMELKKSSARASKLEPFRDDILLLKQNQYSEKQILEFLQMNDVQISQTALNSFIRARKGEVLSEISIHTNNSNNSNSDTDRQQPEPQVIATAPTEPKEQPKTTEQPSEKPVSAKPEPFEQPTTPGLHKMPDGTTIYINNKGKNPFIDERTGRRRFPSMDEIDAEHLI